MSGDDRFDSELRPLLRRSVGSGGPGDAVRRSIVLGALVRTRSGSRRAVWASAVAAVLVITVCGLAVSAWTRRLAGRTPDAPERISLLEAESRTFAVSVGRHRVTLERNTRLWRVESDGPDHELRLDSGRASFDVEPLPAGAAFRVRTDEAVVEVVGTRFSVERHAACTRVHVTEGRVRVAPSGGAAILLGADEGRSFCRSNDLDSTTLAEPGEVLIRDALAASTSASPESSARAQAAFGQYLADHPEGVFAEEALFGLWKLSVDTDPPLARRSAEALIQRFPASDRAEHVRRWILREGDQSTPVPTKNRQGRLRNEESK